MKNKIPIYIIVCFALILLIGFIFFVKAGDTTSLQNNSKTYNSTSKTIKISNSTANLSKITLNTPIVNNVFVGKDVLVANFTIENIGNYSNVFNDMQFYDLNNKNKSIIKNFTYKFFDGVSWKPLDTKAVLPKGNITMGIFTDVYPNDYIEWIPTIYNVKITDWATWNSSYTTNLSLYWDMNEGSGTKVIDTYSGLYNGTLAGTWVTSGIRLGATNYSALTDSLKTSSIDATNFTKAAPFTINFWLNANNYLYTDGSNIFSTVNGTNNAGFGVIFQPYTTGLEWQFIMQDASTPNGFCRVTTNDNLGNGGIWQMLTLSYDGSGLSSGIKIYVNGTSLATTNCGGWTGALPANWMSMGNLSLMWDTGVLYQARGETDELAVWKNRQLSDYEVSQLYNNGLGIFYGNYDTAPGVSLNFPVNNSVFSNIQALGFNVSATDDYNLSNLSLYINGIRNITIYPNSTFAYINQSLTFGEGSYNFSAYAVDNASQGTWSDNKTFIVNLNPGLTINSPGISLSTLTFNLNITPTDAFNISYCSYNITRGGAVEIGTTTINSANYTEPVIVSGYGNYNLTVRCNDTYNLYNQTSIPLSITFSGGSGSGGGNTIINNYNNQTIAANQPQCQRFSDAYDDWVIQTSGLGLWERIKAGWKVILNLVFCKAEASIAPIDYIP